MTQQRTFIIDTDTASDDAVAILMALRAPGIHVSAITVVGGNVPVDLGCRNALATLELAGAPDIPVYRGAEGPLFGPLHTAQNVHGEEGMGGVELPATRRTVRPEHAVDALVRHIRAAPPGTVDLVTLGPLTNVALALQKDPGIARLVRHVYMMAGTADHLGNVTPSAEYNVWVDPEAARAVFHAGWPITMIGWDISRKYAVMTDADCEELRALGTPEAHFVVDINADVREFCRTVTHLDGFDCPDSIAMAVAIDASVATRTELVHLDVETRGELTRGQTVIDYLNVTKLRRNVEVVLEADARKFRDMLWRTVARFT